MIRAATAASAENVDVAARMHESMTTQTSLTNRIRKGAEAGELKPDTSASAVAESLVGAMLYRILLRQPLTPAFVEQLLHVVFNGIGA